MLIQLTLDPFCRHPVQLGVPIGVLHQQYGRCQASVPSRAGGPPLWLALWLLWELGICMFYHESRTGTGVGILLLPIVHPDPRHLAQPHHLRAEARNWSLRCWSVAQHLRGPRYLMVPHLAWTLGSLRDIREWLEFQEWNRVCHGWSHQAALKDWLKVYSVLTFQ